MSTARRECLDGGGWGPWTPASAPPASCLAADFNRRTSWADVLTPAGWTVHAQGAAGWAYWTRPAGFLRAPQTAVTGLDPTGERLCAYGARTAPFEPWAHYDRFTAYALLNHGGDVRTASAALAAQGYEPPPAGWARQAWQSPNPLARETHR